MSSPSCRQPCLRPLVLALAAALLSSAAAAQEAPPAPDQEGAATELDTIVVTARKRNESILEVPMNITAISAQELSDRNLSTVMDVYRTIAGGASATGELILRGLSGSNSPSPGTTNQFVDGVPFEFSNIFDVERIEVLRGPQGTLWGSNAIGGTVQVVTRKPQMNEFEAFATLLGTEQKNVSGNASRVEAGLNIPIVDDRLAMRVATSIAHTPLPIVNAHTGNQSKRENEFIRTQLQWEPSEDMRFNLGHIYTEERGLGTNRADRSRPGFYRLPILIEDPDSPWGYDVSHDFVECPDEWERPACFTNGAPRVRSDPKYTIYERFDGWFKNATNLYSLSFDHDDLFGIASMHYVGSYRKEATNSLDNWTRLDMDDMTPTWIINKDSTRRVTHELRFQNVERRAGIDWTVGLFQDREWGGYNPDVQWQYHLSDPLSVAIFSDWIHDPDPDYSYWTGWDALGVHNIAELGQYLYGDPSKNYNLTRISAKDLESAAFGEASYRFETGAGDFELTGGIRYYKLESMTHSLQTGIWIGPESDEVISAGKESGNRKKVSLSWMPSANMNVYALYSEGYRPGGDNLPSLPAACQGDDFADQFDPRFNSDQIDNYELGFKASLLDRRLRIASSVYKIDWVDVQAPIYMPSCGFSYTANAAEARSRGVEFESSLFIGNSTVLTFNASYTNSEMMSDVTAIGARKGDDMTMVPKYNAYLALDHEFRLFGRPAFARIDVAAYGSYKSHFNVRDEDVSPAYRTVNLSGRMPLNDQATLSLHVSNLFNEEYATYKAARSRSSSRSALHEIYGAERAFTIRFDYNFY